MTRVTRALLVVPVLALAAALPQAWASHGAVGMTPAAGRAGAAAVGGCAPGIGWGNENVRFERRVVALVNAHRTQMGLRPLRIVRTLTRSARWKALHMARYQYMAHDDPAPPVARSVSSRLAACGFHGGWWGENIAYGFPSPASVLQGWLNSPGHRANIENARYRVTGVGAASHAGGPMFWSQEFGA
jgi:uncharacterized protein YkwD